jgi:hypothetical protein
MFFLATSRISLPKELYASIAVGALIMGEEAISAAQSYH